MNTECCTIYDISAHMYAYALSVRVSSAGTRRNVSMPCRAAHDMCAFVYAYMRTTNKHTHIDTFLHK
jgi:hypothetical protein